LLLLCKESFFILYLASPGQPFVLLHDCMNFGGTRYIMEDFGRGCQNCTRNMVLSHEILGTKTKISFLGPIIRIGPNEVHIHDLEYFNQLLSFRPLNKWAMTAHQFGVSEALFGTEEYKHCTKKRAAFGNSFSRSAALKNQDLMNKHLDKACDAIIQRNTEGQTVDLA